MNLIGIKTSGLYYNPITIVNDDASVVSKLETHLLTPLESSRVYNTGHASIFLQTRQLTDWNSKAESITFINSHDK